MTKFQIKNPLWNGLEGGFQSPCLQKLRFRSIVRCFEITTRYQIKEASLDSRRKEVENPPRSRQTINCNAVRAHVCLMQRHVLIIVVPVYTVVLGRWRICLDEESVKPTQTAQADSEPDYSIDANITSSITIVESCVIGDSCQNPLMRSESHPSPGSIRVCLYSCVNYSTIFLFFGYVRSEPLHLPNNFFLFLGSP